MDNEAGGGQQSKGEARAPGGPPGTSAELRSYLLQSVTRRAMRSCHGWPTWSVPSSALPFQDHPSRRDPLSCLLRASIRCRSDSSVCSVCLALTQPGVSEAAHRVHSRVSARSVPQATVCAPVMVRPPMTDMGKVSSLRLLEMRLLRTHTSPARGLLRAGCLSSYQRLTWRPLCCADLLTRQPCSRASGCSRPQCRPC